MKITRWSWLAVGLGAGYVLGTRAGRSRYDQLSQWTRKTAEDFGVAPAVGVVIDTARTTAGEVRAAAATKSHDALDNGASLVSDKLEAVGENLGAGSG